MVGKVFSAHNADLVVDNLIGKGKKSYSLPEVRRAICEVTGSMDSAVISRFARTLGEIGFIRPTGDGLFKLNVTKEGGEDADGRRIQKQAR